MRALIFDGQSLELVTRHPEPQLVDGEAIVRPTKVGVTHTDVELCRGLLGFRGVLGHQFVGVVEQCEKTSLRGSRVVGSIHAVCGRCDMCRCGLATHCREQTILGLAARDGCLADRFALPQRNLHVVPDSLDDDQALFAVDVAAAVQTARQLTVQSKPFITVLGDGPQALIMVQVMARLNASVRLVGQDAGRLALCERWGIKHRAVADIGRHADQDVVVDCTGSKEGLPLAMELVRPRGKIMMKTLLAASSPASSLDLSQLVMKEVELIGSGSGPIAEALTVLDRREVDVIPLLGKRTRLSEGVSILKAAASPNGLRVVVEMDGR